MYHHLNITDSIIFCCCVGGRVGGSLGVNMNIETEHRTQTNIFGETFCRNWH